MSKMTNIVNKTRKFTKQYGPQILTGVGIAGMLATTVLAVKATPKAMELIREKEEELKVEELTKTEVIKTTWQCYIPTVFSFGFSTVCFLRANQVLTKRGTMIAAACKLSEEAFKEYREAVVETIGETKEKEIRDKAAEKKLKKTPKESSSEVFVCGTGNVLCFDSISSRYFYSSVNDIKRVENTINKLIIDDMYASLSELYEELGLKRTSISDELGWNIEDGLLDISFGSHITDEGEPCVVLEYGNPPVYNFDMLSK